MLAAVGVDCAISICIRLPKEKGAIMQWQPSRPQHPARHLRPYMRKLTAVLQANVATVAAVMGPRNEALRWRLLLLILLAAVGLGWHVCAQALTVVDHARLTLTVRGQAQAPQTVALPYDWDQ